MKIANCKFEARGPAEFSQRFCGSTSSVGEVACLIRQAEGLPATSRWLSEATPPEPHSLTRPHPEKGASTSGCRDANRHARSLQICNSQFSIGNLQFPHLVLARAPRCI